ncbi:MAG: hypothetical protein RLZZ385_160 [Pseudomonadota bacterium]|jgi:uncharacterized protein
MSDSPLPGSVDARKIFASGGSVRGFVDLRRLQNLVSLLAEPRGEARVWLNFLLDSGGRRSIVGGVTATLKVKCQRCLQPLDIHIDEPVNLVLVADDAAAKLLDTSVDPWISQEPRIDLLGLVEEQLVLSLPIVSYHQSGPCGELMSYTADSTDEPLSDNNKGTAAGSGNGRAGDTKNPEQSPFKVLKDLLKS